MTPDKKQFIEYAKYANVVPVYAELLADMQTPVSSQSLKTPRATVSSWKALKTSTIGGGIPL